MMIVCPHCKVTLETDIRNVGQKATCQNCGGSFVINDVPTRIDLGFARSDARRVRFLKKLEWIKCHAKYCLCGIAVIVLLLSAYALYCSGDRYMLAKGDNGTVYRVDRKTGETVMIRGSTMRVVSEYQPQVSVPSTPPRELSTSELSKITGRGGVGSGSLSDYFSGTIYNGVSDLDLRSIKVAVLHKDRDGKSYKREYQCELGIVEPLKTSSFHFTIIRGEEKSDYSYPWRIVGATGVPHTK